MQQYITPILVYGLVGWQINIYQLQLHLTHCGLVTPYDDTNMGKH